MVSFQNLNDGGNMFDLVSPEYDQVVSRISSGIDQSFEKQKECLFIVIG